MNIHMLSIICTIGMILFPIAEDPPPMPDDGAQIVFVSNRGENPEATDLYLLDMASGEITPLETGLEAPVIPQWSPDREKVLFSVREIWNLYTIDATGENLTQITDFRSNNGDWSPDGSQIVFQSDHDNEPENVPDIYVIDASGENLTEILDVVDVADFNPRWTPDGEHIFWISTQTGNYEIFLMNADGTEPVKISNIPNPIIGAEVSPDGTKIAVTAWFDGIPTEIFVIGMDGSEDTIIRLTDNEFQDSDPSWSPSGEKIVFSSDRSGNLDLWMINADGTDLVQLTDDEYEDSGPDW